MRTKILDRNTKPLAVGQSVRVQYCIGRYGQTRQVRGTITEINLKYSGLQMRLAEDQPAFTEYGSGDGRVPSVRYNPGDLFYVAISTDKFGPEDGVYIAYHKHDDFEHGHEKWVEIL